jgi:hypothetical protein
MVVVEGMAVAGVIQYQLMGLAGCAMGSKTDV